MKPTFSRHITRFSLIVVALGLGCSQTTTPGPQTRARDIQLIVETTELASAFEQSEVSAEQLYNGKRARLIGIFTRTEPLADAHVAMAFEKSLETFRPVRCIFDSVNAIALNTLKDGDKLEVTGTITGFSQSRYFVAVEDCVVE